MTKQTAMDVTAIKQSIEHGGEFRVHLISSKAGTGVTARMWHWDGFKVGKASGGSYDRRGAALGEAISLFFKEELKAVPAGYTRAADTSVGVKNEDGIYGLSRYEDCCGAWYASLDGACGLSQMLKVLEALGFTSVRVLETGPLSTLILATGRNSVAHSV